MTLLKATFKNDLVLRIFRVQDRKQQEVQCEWSLTRSAQSKTFAGKSLSLMQASISNNNSGGMSSKNEKSAAAGESDCALLELPVDVTADER